MINSPNQKTLYDALASLVPAAVWGIAGDTYEGIIWKDEVIPQPTKEQVETRISELQAIADSMAYQSRRKQEYPPLENLADALFWQAHGDNSKMTAYLAQVAAVKDKYPKGTA
jgi:hypothetical protein